MISKAHKSALDAFDEQHHRIRIFANTVLQFFVSHPSLSADVHSVKLRVKGRENLLEKLQRKQKAGVTIDGKNLFKVITDLAGVRVFHIHAAQFEGIHKSIISQVKSGDWILAEDPKAFSWDPESVEFFRGFGFEPEIRPTFYTSIHYLVRPSAGSDLCCEIQVRTLFEEIWGEVDHSMNYPFPVNSIACREQLRALSKLVGTGGRLVDSIIRSRAEADENLKVTNGFSKKSIKRSAVGPRGKSDAQRKRKVTALPASKQRRRK